MTLSRPDRCRAPSPSPSPALRFAPGLTLCLSLCLALLTGAPLSAAPADYADKIPVSVMEMKRVKQTMADGALGAFFDGPVGRASLWIWPAPQGEPGSVWSNPDTVLRGETPGARRILMQMVDRNLENGTKALGPNYKMIGLTFDTMTVNDLSATCAMTDRAQDPAAVKPGEQQMFLRERLCAIQNDDDVATLSTTRPYLAGAGDEAKGLLIAFTGEVLFPLIGQELTRTAP